VREPPALRRSGNGQEHEEGLGCQVSSFLDDPQDMRQRNQTKD
jgi:hypothetical protein